MRQKGFYYFTLHQINKRFDTKTRKGCEYSQVDLLLFRKKSKGGIYKVVGNNTTWISKDTWVGCELHPGKYFVGAFAEWKGSNDQMTLSVYGPKWVGNQDKGLQIVETQKDLLSDFNFSNECRIKSYLRVRK